MFLKKNIGGITYYSNNTLGSDRDLVSTDRVKCTPFLCFCNRTVRLLGRIQYI